MWKQIGEKVKQNDRKKVRTDSLRRVIVYLGQVIKREQLKKNKRTKWACLAVAVVVGVHLTREW